MGKLLILLVVVLAAVWLLRRPRIDAPARRPGKAAPTQAMVACAHCGVHLPQGDTVADAGGRLFCSTAHRLAGPR